MSNFLLYEQSGAIVTLTMNAPEVRNALTGNAAVDEFVAAVERINADPTVRVMILTGAGTVFSSGGNVKDMKRFTTDAVTPAEIAQWYRTGIQRLPLALQRLEVPSIAAVNGAAIGAGNDLACMCDLRIASTNASFAESFIRVGRATAAPGCCRASSVCPRRWRCPSPAMRSRRKRRWPSAWFHVWWRPKR
jgi:enoyl-CoA hydratase/carnithine racemase